jgi:hypothetical protein
MEAVATALAANTSGVMQVKTTVLLTSEEVDAATKRTAAFRAARAPGDTASGLSPT